jgi:hypothetical protein
MVRSDKQNRYYWKCIVLPLGLELGYHKYEMHEVLKHTFIADKSKELDTKDFQRYCEEIRIWALTELGIRLMLPNEYK